jgi:uncharacterized protein DUF6899
MPYITQETRNSVELLADEYGLDYAAPNSGCLNYCISRLLNSYLKMHGKTYSTMNDIVGVLECSKMEFYRRIASEHEDKKIIENGDVYHE